MFRSILCLLSVLALGISVNPALAAKGGKVDPEAHFKKLDKDNDGKLSPDEFKGKRTGAKADKAETVFKAKDKDKDGYLVLDEYRAHGKKNK